MQEVISQLQKLVWTSAALPTAAEEFVRELAYDLDYFERNPKAREEDSSLVDEATAIAEITQVIARLKEVDSKGE